MIHVDRIDGHRVTECQRAATLSIKGLAKTRIETL